MCACLLWRREDNNINHLHTKPRPMVTYKHLESKEAYCVTVTTSLTAVHFKSVNASYKRLYMNKVVMVFNYM